MNKILIFCWLIGYGVAGTGTITTSAKSARTQQKKRVGLLPNTA